MIANTKEKHITSVEELEQYAMPKIHGECPHAREFSREFMCPQQWMERIRLKECAARFHPLPNTLREFFEITPELRRVSDDQCHTRMQ